MEKEFFDIDKKTVDRGWSAMQELLKQELPAPEKKRRRWFFWFWVGGFMAIGLAAGAGGWKFFATEKRPDAPQELPILGKPIAAEPVSPTLESTENQVVGAPEKRILPKPETQSIASNPSAGLPVIEQLGFENQQVTQSREPLLGENGTGFSGSKIAETAPEMPIAVLPVQPKSEFPSLEKLPSKLVFLPENQRVASKMQPIEQPLNFALACCQKPEPTWAFGLTSGVLSFDLPNLNGATAGAVVDWKPTKRFGIRTGLQYQFSKFSARNNSAPVVQLDAWTYLQETGDSSFLAVDQTSSPGTNTSVQDIDSLAAALASQQVFLPVTRLHRLEMPISVFYQPSKKWRFYGGLTIGRVISATAGNYKLTPDDLGNSVKSTTAEFSNAGYNRLVTSNFRKWTTDFQVGAGFRPNRRLEINLFLKSGLQRQKSAEFNKLAGSQSQDVLGSISTKRWPMAVQLSGSWFF